MYAAELDDSNIIKRVIVAESLSWCENVLGGKWVETFKNTPNKNYAGIGWQYNASLDNFHDEQPYNSWILNSQCKWEAPIPEPTLTTEEELVNTYDWDEDTLSWVLTPNDISGN